ncbi:MAG: exo-alpha-sialidase [Sedimentisphaerales bacterium]|nr:exo-alpha-sialidase [Sedimentisphaerales bacterium]
MRIGINCLITIVIILAICPDPAANAAMESLLVIEPGKDNPRNSEGDIIELKDGRLCLIYTRFTGGSGDHATADLAMRISKDNGLNWSNDKIVVRRMGGLNVMSVSLLRLKSGDIALFFLRKTSKEDCRPLMCISRDEAKTWSRPTVCITDKAGYYVLNNDRTVQLRSSRLVLPVAWHQGPGQARDTAGVIMCYLSDDNGKTWRRNKDSFKGYAPGGQRITVQEPGVIELKDGRLMMYMRTNAGSQYICYSQDGGETWSKARPSNLASPLSPASIKRIPWTGDLLCIWNDHSGVHSYPKGRRTPLCLAISKDEGKTWDRSIIIEGNPDGWYCYTSITFVKDRVLLAYCAGDKTIGGLNRLKVLAISKDKLVSFQNTQSMPPKVGFCLAGAILSSLCFTKDKTLGVLKGGFESFNTPKPATAEEWEKRKIKLRKTLWKLLGDIPPLFTPEVKITKREEKDGYTLERFTFDNGVGDTVFGYILIPDNHKGRGPAILYNHYHGGKYKQGKEEVITKAFTKLNFATGEELTRKGYVVQCIDAYAFGERRFQGPAGKKEEGGKTESSLFKTFLWEGRTLWGMMVRDDILALNYLVSRPEVDSNRIAAMGMSMGSTRTWWLAALDERIKVAVSVACLTRYQNLIARGKVQAHGIYYYVSNMLKEHIDTESVIGLIAPRPHLTLTGDKDGGSPADGVKIINTFQKHLYKCYEKQQNFRGILYPGVGHTYTPEMWEVTLRWLKKHI